MSRLIESIKLLDGRLYNLAYHADRMRRSLGALYHSFKPVDLDTIIRNHDVPARGFYKCRIVYDDSSLEVTFTPYVVRPVRRIKVVVDDAISYPLKFEDRDRINQLFALRGDCDDVLIVRAGKVTDCSYSNVVFRKGANWYTPESPLLEGTMRSKLLQENKIRLREIVATDIRSFSSLKIVNALLEFDGPEIDVSDIVF